MIFGKLVHRFGTAEPKSAETVELSEAEFRALIDERVRESVGIPLDEFKAQLADGRLDAEAPSLAGLAILIGARTG